MTDDDSRYALAFPLTDDFRRVLSTFTSSLGFGRAEIELFVVHPEGHVEHVLPNQITDWIRAL